MNDIKFINAIQQAGITPPSEIVSDGEIHRFSSSGKPNDESGWYVFHDDGFPAGIFGNWRTGLTQTWRADIGRQLTSTEQAAHYARIEAMKAKREADDIKTKAEAKQLANDIWDKANAVTAHAYLTKKGVNSYGIKQTGDALIIPLRSDGEIHSLQFINEDGSKKFLTGGRIKACYFSMGKPKDVIYICEGYATGASIFEATNCAVVVAFNSGNLSPVAKAIRTKYPNLKLVICADDDQSGVGLNKANEAASNVIARVVMPNFGSDKPVNATDFNDLHQLRGLEAVRSELMLTPVASGDYSKSVGAMPSPDDFYASVSLQCAADIAPESIHWLWEGWLAKGKLHIFAGTAGTGKTTIAIALAATITTGGKFPDGSKCNVGSVLIWSGEDSPADTLVPRLMAAGANLSKVHFVCDTNISNELRSFDPASDMQPLMLKAASIPDLALLIVDPIVNAVAGDSHKNGEVRRALQPIVDFGEKLNCAVLGITHFSKGGQGKDPLERVTGSLAFGALARIVLATAKIEEGGKTKRIVCRAKSNIGIDSGGFEYDLQQKEVKAGIFSSYALWGDAIEGSARELLSEPDNREKGDNGSSALEDAKDFLRDLLVDGELAQKQIEADAKGASHSWATVRRAKAELSIISSKSKLDGRWYWKLPSYMLKIYEDAQDAHLNNVGTLSALPKLEGGEND